MTERDSPPLDPPPHPLPATLLHDLRTPLNHIIGYSEMLMERADDEGNPEMLPQLAKVRAAGYHLLALLDRNFVASGPLPAQEGAHEQPRS